MNTTSGYLLYHETTFSPHSGLGLEIWFNTSFSVYTFFGLLIFMISVYSLKHMSLPSTWRQCGCKNHKLSIVSFASFHLADFSSLFISLQQTSLSLPPSSLRATLFLLLLCILVCNYLTLQSALDIICTKGAIQNTGLLHCCVWAMKKLLWKLWLSSLLLM